MTQDQSKTKELLITELRALRLQMAQLESAHRSEQIRRQELETAHRQTEARLQAVLSDIDGGYYEVDLAGNLRFCNVAACIMFGYSLEELLGTNYRRYTSEATARDRKSTRLNSSH